MSTAEYDNGLKRWREEMVPWGRELADRLEADDTEVSLVSFVVEWYGWYDPDWGKIPAARLRFRVAGRRDYKDPEGDPILELSDIRLYLDFDSYDVVYNYHIPLGTPAPSDFSAYLEIAAVDGSGGAPKGTNWTEVVKGFPYFNGMTSFYHAFLKKWYDVPPEEETMHEIIGWDESLIEASNAALKMEMWKGELMELLKGMRGESGWREYSVGNEATNFGWYPEGHSNYYMGIRVGRDDAPTFIVFVDPDLVGSTTGWRTARPLRNYKQVIGLPKSLQAWVKSDIEKMRGQENSYRFTQMQKVAARGVPHDLERAYQRLRQILIPAVEPEEMHELSGWDESRALTEEVVNVFKFDRFPVEARAGYWMASHADFEIKRWTKEEAYALSLAVWYFGKGTLRTTKTPIFANGLVYDNRPNVLLHHLYGFDRDKAVGALSELSGREIWLKLLDQKIENPGIRDPGKANRVSALLAKARDYLTTNFPPEVERFTEEKFKVAEPEEMHEISGWDESVDPVEDPLGFVKELDKAGWSAYTIKQGTSFMASISFEGSVLEIESNVRWHEGTYFYIRFFPGEGKIRKLLIYRLGEAFPSFEELKEKGVEFGAEEDLYRKAWDQVYPLFTPVPEEETMHEIIGWDESLISKEDMPGEKPKEQLYYEEASRWIKGKYPAATSTFHRSASSRHPYSIAFSAEAATKNIPAIKVPATRCWSLVFLFNANHQLVRIFIGATEIANQYHYSFAVPPGTEPPPFKEIVTRPADDKFYVLDAEVYEDLRDFFIKRIEPEEMHEISGWDE